MRNEDLGEFSKVLADVMAGYGKPLPDAGAVKIWFAKLLPYDARVIRRAFEDYAFERPDFAPVPNSIIAKCKLLDGRPDDNEAWAIALTSRSEEETVVWTEETRDAFGACQPVLATGDEVGARMAFKDAYARLVAAARAENRPAVWVVSEGWDKTRKVVALEKAQREGLLPAPPAHLMIGSNLPPAKPEGLKRLMDELAKLEDPIEKLARQRAERLAIEDEEDRVRKAEIDARAKEYLKAHPEARYGNLPKPMDGGK